MTYVYRCKVCGETIEVQQGINDEHKYEHCGQECARVFELKEVKKNKGFFSDMLGCYVKSQADYDEKYERFRYANDLNKYIGNNATPKDEWIEEKVKRESRVIERQNNDDSGLEEGHYKTIKTFE